MIKKIIFIIFILFLTLPEKAFGHQLPPKEISKVSEIKISKDMVTIDYTLTYYGLAEIEELWKVDKDRNGKITPQEKLAYFKERVLDLEKTLYIIINDVMAPVSLIEKIQFSGQPFTQRFKFGVKFSDVIEDENQILFYDRKYGPLCKKNEVTINYSTDVAVQKVVNLDKGLEVDFKASASGVSDFSARPSERRLKPATPLVNGVAHFSARPIEGDIVSGIETIEISPTLDSASRGNVSQLYEKLRLILSGILSNPNLNIKLILIGFILAFILGAFHALTPGHGKTLTGVYIIGSHGTMSQAALVGLVVTLTHTISVVLLGLVAYFMSRYFIPEKIFPWVGFGSGILIFIIGIWMLVRSTRKSALHEHEHIKKKDLSLWSIISVGLVGGAVPCPDAIVVLLIAVAINKILFGLFIIVAFGMGLALVLIGIGMAMVGAGALVERFFHHHNRFLQILPRISASIIMILGLFIAIRSLVSAGILWLNI